MLVLINGLVVLALIVLIATLVPIIVGYVVTSIWTRSFRFNDDDDLIAVCGVYWAVGFVTICVVIVVLILALVIGNWVTPPPSLG